MNPGVDEYLRHGCMRCKYGGTPQCKVHNWTNELVKLREIALDSGLTEVIKWGVPCYTWNGKNIILISAFKEYACMSFVKGSLMRDAESLFTRHGNESQAFCLLKYTDTASIFEQELTIQSYIQEAIEVEKSGKKIQYKSVSEYEIPEEFQRRLADFPELKESFDALTPGRQKGYILHFSSAKQSKTREARIDKWMGPILNGKGMHDR